MAPFQVQRKQLDDHKAAAIGTSPLVAEAAVNTQIPGRHDRQTERETDEQRKRERLNVLLPAHTDGDAVKPAVSPSGPQLSMASLSTLTALGTAGSELQLL